MLPAVLRAVMMRWLWWWRWRLSWRILAVCGLCALLVFLHREYLVGEVKHTPRQRSHNLQTQRPQRQPPHLPPELSATLSTPATLQQRPTSMASFEARKRKVRTACSALQNDNEASSAGARAVRRRGHRPPFRYRLLWVKSLAFCPLPKTGTTFWKWILSYMDRGLTGPLLSHKYGDIHQDTLYMADAGRLSSSERAKSKKVVFVREPYERLFSAYVDKVFTPRWENWQQFARPALEFSRRGASEAEKRCAHNVTFAEYVRNFLYTELSAGKTSRRSTRDEHVVPISQQCHFCGVDYDFIGRQESFAEDTIGILVQLNASADMLALSDFQHEYQQYFMEELVRYTCNKAMKPIVKEHRCTSAEEVLRRVWKAVQIRGTLAAEEPFPWTSEDVAWLGGENVTWETFLSVVNAAYNRSVSGARADGSRISSGSDDNQISSTSKRRWCNREEAMLEAYSTVPLRDRQALRDVVFRDDFRFFGYEPNHTLVFPPGDEFPLRPYRYFDVFDSYLSSKGA